jgi:hypothetical protein
LCGLDGSRHVCGEREIPNLLFNHHVEHARLCFTQHLPHALTNSPARKGSQTKAKTMHISTRILLCLAGLMLAVIGYSISAATVAPVITLAAIVIGIAGTFAVLASVTQ